MRKEIKLAILIVLFLISVFGYLNKNYLFNTAYNNAAAKNILGVQTSSPPTFTPTSTQNNSTQSANINISTIGQRTKTSRCISQNGLPDNACTPGALIAGASKDQICVSGYSKSVRNVPSQIKDEAYAEYGIASHEPGQYEVDHLISLELGGSNDISNLWPESADPRPGFHEKDSVENYLHQQVCNGSITLEQAQSQIATDWYAVYKKIAP